MLDTKISFRSNTLSEVIIEGEQVIDLESGKSEINISQADISEMAVREIQDVVKMQAGGELKTQMAFKFEEDAFMKHNMWWMEFQLRIL